MIHEGALGFTQALSYALKRAYERLQDESSGGTNVSYKKKYSRRRVKVSKKVTYTSRQ